MGPDEALEAKLDERERWLALRTVRIALPNFIEDQQRTLIAVARDVLVDYRRWSADADAYGEVAARLQDQLRIWLPDDTEVSW
jgi:hypothetical protein